MYLLCAMQKHVTKYIATLHISPSLIDTLYHKCYEIVTKILDISP